jgi:hypothetical protein
VVFQGELLLRTVRRLLLNPRTGFDAGHGCLALVQRAKLSANGYSQNPGTGTFRLASVYSYAVANSDLCRENAGQVSVAVVNQYLKRQSGASAKEVQCD